MRSVSSAKVAPAPGDESSTRPWWMDHESHDEIVGQCDGSKSGETHARRILQVLRIQTAKLQPKTPAFAKMLSALSALPGQVEKRKELIRKEVMDMFRTIHDRSDGKGDIKEAMATLSTDFAEHGASIQEMLYTVGPTGALPFHDAFLLGQNELGKEIVTNFFCRHGIDGKRQLDGSFLPALDKGLNTPYVSDLEAWKPFVKNTFDDGGLYTGETALHIAIVQGNISLVKWMLENGISITARAVGSFFKPKASKREEDLQEVLTTLHGKEAEAYKNEYSMCDYGEFPFSFATCMGNIEILELLAKHAEKGGIGKEELIQVLKTQRKIRSSLGTNEEIVVSEQGGLFRLLVGLQDSHGNTALHMAVRYSKKECFDWIMAFHGEECMRTLNADAMTPFTLAAHLGNVDMFNHILSKYLSHVVWAFGDKSMMQMSLTQLDSYRTSCALHRDKRWRSALEIIVSENITALMSDHTVTELLAEKWNKFAKARYTQHFIAPFCIFLLNFYATLVLRLEELDEPKQPSFSSLVNTFSFSLEDLGSWAHRRALVSLLLHLLLIVVWLQWLLWSAYNWSLPAKPHKHGIRAPSLPIRVWALKKGAALMPLLTWVCIVLTVAGRAADLPALERHAWSLGALMSSAQLMLLLLPFKLFGHLVISAYVMLTSNQLIFLAVYFLIDLGFALALELSFLKCPLGVMPAAPAYATRLPGTLYYLFWTGLDGTTVDEEMLRYSRDPVATRVFQNAWVVIFTMLGLNMLIGIICWALARGQEDITSVWTLLNAHIVLSVENTLSHKQRRQCSTYRCGKAGNDWAKKQGLQPLRAGPLKMWVSREQVAEAERQHESDQEFFLCKYGSVQQATDFAALFKTRLSSALTGGQIL